MLNGIIQWLRLQLDQRSKAQLVKEAREAARQIGEEFEKAGKKGGNELEKGIEKGIHDAEREAKAAGKRMANDMDGAAKNVGGSFGKLGGVLAGVFSVMAIKDFIVSMWELGSAAEETQDKFNVVFGQQAAGQVQEFLDEWATFAGLSRTNGQEFAATAGAIVQGMGASQQASGEFSERMLRLAGDLTSLHNVPIEETFAALRSGLAGEFDPLQRFGLGLRDVTIEARASADANGKAKDSLTDLEKAQATLNLLYERAGPALDNLNDTKDSSANRARYLKAEYDNLRATLAERLMPIFAGVIDILMNNREEIKQVAHVAGILARVIGGHLWAALNGVASLLGGAVAAGLGLVISLYRTLEGVVLRAVLAKELFARVIGKGSQEAVDRANAAIERNRLNQDGSRLFREGVREMGRGITEYDDRYMQVWGLGQGPKQDVRWRPPRDPVPQTEAPADPKAAERAEKERQQELSDQVRLLQEMSERRAEFPELIAEATALERQLTGELNAQGTSTKRRVTLMKEVDSLQEIINGTDATSLRNEAKRQQNLTEQVRLVGDLMDLYGLTPDLIAMAGQTEAALTQELLNQETSLERQLEIQGQLNQIREARGRNEPLTQEQLIEQDAQEILDHYALVADGIKEIADGFATAWEDAFERVLVEGGNVADGLEAIGRTMGGALLGALGNFAKGKMQENIASAIESLAKAYAAYARYDAASGAGYLKSAATHGAAAAAWGILAGGSAAAGRAVSGTGGASGGGGGRTGGDEVDKANNGQEVHIYIDPLDPGNPAVQRVVYAAGTAASERYGANMQINVHPRTLA